MIDKLKEPRLRFPGFTDAWEQRKLGDVVEFLDTRRKPLEGAKRIAGPYPYYGASGIVDYVDGYIFDEELVLHINTALMILAQIGVGKGFSIHGYEETWTDLISDMSKLEMIKTYIYLKVRMIFDPPTGSVAETFNNQIAELEWRINVVAETHTE